MVKIDHDSNVPVYKQIAAQIKGEILTEKLKASEYLPSLRVLSKSLNVSLITTKKAYDVLSSEGLNTASKGKGYFVNAQDKKMIHEHYMRQIGNHLLNAIKSAKIAGISEETLSISLHTLWCIEDFDRY